MTSTQALESTQDLEEQVKAGVKPVNKPGMKPGMKPGVKASTRKRVIWGRAVRAARVSLRLLGAF